MAKIVSPTPTQPQKHQKLKRGALIPKQIKPTKDSTKRGVSDQDKVAHRIPSRMPRNDKSHFQRGQIRPQADLVSRLDMVELNLWMGPDPRFNIVESDRRRAQSSASMRLSSTP